MLYDHSREDFLSASDPFTQQFQWFRRLTAMRSLKEMLDAV